MNITISGAHSVLKITAPVFDTNRREHVAADVRWRQNSDHTFSLEICVHMPFARGRTKRVWIDVPCVVFCPP
jgi:hypothetical protein